MTANSDEIETICECQYSLTLSSEKDAYEMKDNFNDVPSIHEIDEDDSETEKKIATIEQLNHPINDKDVVENIENLSDEASTYMSDSFYSDESCEELESDITNVTPRSLTSNSASLLHVDVQRNESSKNTDIYDNDSKWKDDLQDNESCTINNKGSSRATTANRLLKPRRCRRWNMSFTDEEMRKIERENELLLRKIMAQQKPQYKIFKEHTIQPRVSSSAINRRKFQKKIEDDNMLLVKKIQQAKSCVLRNTSKMGCRLTYL